MTSWLVWPFGDKINFLIKCEHLKTEDTDWIKMAHLKDSFTWKLTGLLWIQFLEEMQKEITVYT